MKDVSERSETLTAALESALPDETVKEKRAEWKARSAFLKSDIESRVAGGESALAAEPSVARLQILEEQLIGLRKKLEIPQQEIGDDIAELSESLARMEESAKVWEKTAEGAQSAGASEPTLQRIASMRREIDRVSDQLASRRNELLTLSDGLVDPVALLDKTLAQVREAIEARIGGIFSLDRSPIWSPRVRETAREELNAGWTGPPRRARRTPETVRERATAPDRLSSGALRRPGAGAALARDASEGARRG